MRITKARYPPQGDSNIVNYSAAEGNGSEGKDITIGVSGVTSSGDVVYGATIVWEDPTFTYQVLNANTTDNVTTRWDVLTHKYVATSTIGYATVWDKTAFSVKVYNHSNTRVGAACYIGADAASATETSYKISGYDVTLGISNPDGETVTMPAAGVGSELDSVSTEFKVSASGTGLDVLADDLIASAKNEAKLGTVVVVIGQESPHAALTGEWVFNEDITPPAEELSVSFPYEVSGVAGNFLSVVYEDGTRTKWGIGWIICCDTNIEASSVMWSQNPCPMSMAANLTGWATSRHITFSEPFEYSTSPAFYEWFVQNATQA